jgi:hypothetical protein
MKKKLLSLCILIIVYVKTDAQEFGTNYVRGKMSTYCADQYFAFSFDNKTFSKVDSYNGYVTKGYSKITDSNYEDNGYYYELRSSDYVLNEYGIDTYRKITKYYHKLLYERRGGELLYIFEYDDINGINSGKFYFTQNGYKLYCK